MWKEVLTEMRTSIDNLYFKRGALTLDELYNARKMVDEYSEVAELLELTSRYPFLLFGRAKQFKRECIRFNNLLMMASFNIQQMERLKAA